jgi:hypothetical protein
MTGDNSISQRQFVSPFRLKSRGTAHWNEQIVWVIVANQGPVPGAEMSRGEFHDDYRQQEVKSSSDRSFGIVFAVVFAVVALWPLTGGGAVRIWAAAGAAALLATALARPSVLAPLNRMWTAFGLFLHKITNPLIMGLVFYGTVTPTALIMRALGKDSLRRRFDRSVESYWIEREPPGPEPGSMDRQF